MHMAPRSAAPETTPVTGGARWLFWTLIAAIALGVAATALVRLFQGSRPSADLTVTSALIAATAGATGAFSWWLLIARPRLVTATRGALAGALTALLSYALVFQVANFVYGAATPELFGASLGERMLVGVVLSIIALAFSGWIAIPLLAIIGTLLAAAQLAAAQLAPARGNGGTFSARLHGFAGRSMAILRGRPLLRWLLVALSVTALLITGLGAWLWTRPLLVGELTSRPAPIGDYGASVAAIRSQADAEAADPAVNPVCASRLFEPGRRTERVVVFFHGFTNCPAQFEPLAQQLVDRGYSVYVPRLPHHGLADRLTGDLARLNADELVRLADRSVDLAHGLGDEVIVVGISGGGNMAAWVAQQRPDVAQVTLVAPMFHVEGLPPFAIRPAASTILAAPNFYMWWDDQRREQALGPPYAYPRYPVHAIGALLRLSFAVQDAANRTPPAVREILVVSNAADTAVSNGATAAVADAWVRNGAVVRRFVFPADLGLNHDVIDVNQPEQRVELVYPTLIELIEE